MTEPIANPTEDQIASWHRTLAPLAFNHTWDLLDRDGLNAEEEEEMLASTFAQRSHWYQVGTPKNRAIADWQVSRVATVLGYADLARRFAQRSLTIAQESELGPFVEGFAHEAIARAAAEVDDLSTFTTHLELARQLAGQIEDSDDRKVLEDDLDQMSS